MSKRIDLNADLGESYGPYVMGDDAAMLDIVSSANVACGFHGGDPLVMMQTVGRCVDRGVSIGAHPGFADVQGFGRRRVHGLTDDELQALVIYQVGALRAAAAAHGTSVRHVKLHGALANMASEDRDLATTCLAAVQRVDPELRVMAMSGTALEEAAAHLGAPAIREVYADRAYNDDGTLVSRSLPGAIIHDPAEAAERVVEMAETGRVVSIDGASVPVTAESVCVHGDHPDSVRMAEQVRAALEGAGFEIAAP